MLVATHHIVPTWLEAICIHFVLYKAFVLAKGALCFLFFSICTCMDSVRKMLGNQIVFIPTIKVTPFSKYFSFHLSVVLVHANWATLIVRVYPTCFSFNPWSGTRVTLFILLFLLLVWLFKAHTGGQFWWKGCHIYRKLFFNSNIYSNGSNCEA